MEATKINPFPELIPQDLIDRAKKLSAPQIADGMKDLGGIPLAGCMNSQMKPVSPDMIVCGTIMTVDTDDGDNFPIHVATYGSPEGYVMVVAGKNHQAKAYMGDLIGHALQAKGFTGIVVDGAIRDKLGLAKLGLPAFSRGFNPGGPSKKIPGEINKAVKCADLDIVPGDLIYGDADGVVVIPRAKIQEVLAAAEKKAAYELERDKTINAYIEAKKNNKPLPELAPQWVLDMLAGKIDSH